MKTYRATATWKVKRANTQMSRHVLVTSEDDAGAKLAGKLALSSFITRNKAVMSIQEVTS
jgi:hypothetical protein